MPARSRDKGKRGELELRDLFRAHGHEARRGGQQGAGGSADAPDVIHDIPGLHVECKRAEAFSWLNRAMEQARKDAGDRAPSLWSRSNRGEWLVTIPASVFFKLVVLL